MGLGSRKMPRKLQAGSPHGGSPQGISLAGPGTIREVRQKMSVTDLAAGSQTGQLGHYGAGPKLGRAGCKQSRGGAVVTQVIPRGVRLRPIRHTVELCPACFPHRVSHRRSFGLLSRPWRFCCCNSRSRRPRRRNPLPLPHQQPARPPPQLPCRRRMCRRRLYRTRMRRRVQKQIREAPRPIPQVPSHRQRRPS